MRELGIRQWRSCFWPSGSPLFWHYLYVPVSSELSFPHSPHPHSRLCPGLQADCCVDPALPYSALLFPPWAPSSYDRYPGDFSRAAISPLVNLGYQRNLDETPCLMVSKGSKKPGIELLLWSRASPCTVCSEWNGFLWPCWHLPGFLEYTWAPILACGALLSKKTSYPWGFLL